MDFPVFRDRVHAGAVLADLLGHWKGHDDLLVLGLPRGGVPVARIVATALDAPLDVLIVRKLGAPGQAELAIGAVGPGGVVVRNHDVIEALDVDEAAFEHTIHAETLEIARRERAYRGDRPPLTLRGCTVVVVDDGLATGATMRAAVVATRAAGARAVVVAVPVGATDTCQQLARVADDVVCAHHPADLLAVGRWYEDFSPTSDDEVRRALTPDR